jgi:hypothetical protein
MQMLGIRVLAVLTALFTLGAGVVLHSTVYAASRTRLCETLPAVVVTIGHLRLSLRAVTSCRGEDYRDLDRSQECRQTKATRE